MHDGGRFGTANFPILHDIPADSGLAGNRRRMQVDDMKTAATFTARLMRDGKWFVAFSPEFPEGNGQGLTEEEALESLRESILLLMEDR